MKTRKSWGGQRPGMKIANVQGDRLRPTGPVVVSGPAAGHDHRRSRRIQRQPLPQREHPGDWDHSSQIVMENRQNQASPLTILGGLQCVQENNPPKAAPAGGYAQPAPQPGYAAPAGGYAQPVPQPGYAAPAGGYAAPAPAPAPLRFNSPSTPRSLAIPLPSRPSPVTRPRHRRASTCNREPRRRRHIPAPRCPGTRGQLPTARRQHAGPHEHSVLRNNHVTRMDSSGHRSVGQWHRVLVLKNARPALLETLSMETYQGWTAWSLYATGGRPGGRTSTPTPTATHDD